MGLYFSRNSNRSNCDCPNCTPSAIKPQSLPNPDPNNWRLVEKAVYGKYCVLKLKYPDCTNYEGEKILVFKSGVKSIMNQKRIDPHFGQQGLIYPIARFPPTSDGWNDACNYAEYKNGVKND